MTPPPPPPHTHNDSAAKVNDILMARIPNPAVTYTSVNSMVNEEQSFKFPAEFLNFIEVSGLPQHILSLKVGMPVILLRSIKPPELMNGTRCIIRSCNRNTVEVEIAVGVHKDEIHLVPRIPLQSSDTTFPFKFQRRQLPLKGCFAMTINKAQGQTLHSIGLDLQQPVFSHGMLYVALSRSGKRDNIAYLCSPQSSITRHVVYKEVL